MKVTFRALLFLCLISGCALFQKNKEGEPTALSDRDRAKLLVDIANASLLEGDPTEALIQLTEAEALDETLPEVHHSKAIAYLARFDSKSALVSAERAYKLSPKNPDINTTIGRILLDSKRYDEALAHLRLAAENPLYKAAYKPRTTIGYIHYMRGEKQQAIGQLDIAIRDGREFACVAYYYRGKIHQELGKHELAIRDLKSASDKYCASNGEAHFALGLTYAKNKDFVSARKKFLDIKKMFPDTELSQKALDQLKYLP